MSNSRWVAVVYGLRMYVNVLCAVAVLCVLATLYVWVDLKAGEKTKEILSADNARILALFEELDISSRVIDGQVHLVNSRGHMVTIRRVEQRNGERTIWEISASRRSRASSSARSS